MKDFRGTPATDPDKISLDKTSIILPNFSLKIANKNKLSAEYSGNVAPKEVLN